MSEDDSGDAPQAALLQFVRRSPKAAWTPNNTDPSLPLPISQLIALSTLHLHTLQNLEHAIQQQLELIEQLKRYGPVVVNHTGADYETALRHAREDQAATADLITTYERWRDQ